MVPLHQFSFPAFTQKDCKIQRVAILLSSGKGIAPGARTNASSRTRIPAPLFSLDTRPNYPLDANSIRIGMAGMA